MRVSKACGGPVRVCTDHCDAILFRWRIHACIASGAITSALP